MFNISYKKYGAITVATVCASRVIDSASVTEFGDEVLAFIEDRPGTYLLLNFTKVDYMSSSMLTELLRFRDEFRRRGGSMRICGLRKEMRQVFEVTKLDKIFHIEDDYKRCLKGFNEEVESRSQVRRGD